MNNEQMKGNWDQFAGKVQQTWGKMTKDDVALYNGKSKEFYGKLEEKHGIAREEAEKQMKKFEKECGVSCDNKNKAA